VYIKAQLKIVEKSITGNDKNMNDKAQ